MKMNWSKYCVAPLYIVSIASIAIVALSFARDILIPMASALSVREGGQDFGVLEANQTRDLVFDVINRTKSEINLMGAERLCGKFGCLEPKGLPLAIPPNSERRVVVGLVAHAAGPFSQEVTLYTDSPDMPELVLKVRGHVELPEAIHQLD